MTSPQRRVGVHSQSAGTSWRVLSFVIANAVFMMLMAWDAATHPGGGANIGAGLTFIAVQVVSAAVWGGSDGRRSGQTGQLLLRWAVVAAASSLITPLYVTVVMERASLQGFLSAVSGTSPLAFAIVFVPAAVSGISAERKARFTSLAHP